MSTASKICLLALVLSLLGCGGGAGSSATGQNANGTGQGGTQVIVSPRLTLAAVQYSSSCRAQELPLSGLTVQIHRGDGKIVKTLATDSRGQLDVEWPAEAKHVSMIQRRMDGSIFVESSVDLQHTDLGRRQFYDNGLAVTCQCKDVGIDWKDLKTAMPEYSLTLGSALNNSNNVYTDNGKLKVCKNSAQSYGKLQAILSPVNSGPSYLAEFDIAEIVAQGELKLNMSAFKNAGKVIAAVSNQSTNVSFRSYVQTADGTTAKQDAVATDKNLVRVFDLAGGKPVVRASSSNYSDGVDYWAMIESPVPSDASVVALNMPNNAVLLTRELKQLAVSLKDGSAVHYDFSSLKAYNSIMLSLLDAQFDWVYLAPLQGKITDLEMPADVQKMLANPNRNLRQASLVLMGSNSSWSYQTYQQKRAQWSRDHKLKLSDDYLHFNQEEVMILTN